MRILYEWPPTRSQRARWALEELGLDYESHPVKLMEGEQNGADYRAIHPLGVVPALKANGYTMFESVAVVMQLIDEHPEKTLAPPPGSPERALYYQWCTFACAEMDPALMAYFDNAVRPLEAMRPPGRQHNAEFADYGRRDFALRAEALSKALRGRDYLLGPAFTGADILIGHSCFMAAHLELIGDYPILQAYHGRLKQRPAYQRSYES